MRAPTANLAVLSGSVEFSTVPLVGLNTALRGGALKVIMVHFDKPQHVLFVKKELQNLQLLRGKKLAVSGPGVIDDLLLREVLAANGVDANREVTILTLGSADTRVTSLITGTVDGAMIIAPFTFTAKDNGFRELVVFKRSRRSLGQRWHCGARRDAQIRSVAGGAFRARVDDGIHPFARQSRWCDQSSDQESQDRRIHRRESLRFIAADDDRRWHAVRR